MPGGRLSIIIIGLILLAGYYMSNQEVNPYSGKSEFNAVSIDQASQLGAQSYSQMLRQEGQNVICGSGAASCDLAGRRVYNTVNEIGERLRLAAIEMEADYLAAGYAFEPVAASFDWTFNVIQSE